MVHPLPTLPAGFIGRRHAIYAWDHVPRFHGYCELLDERGNGTENLAARDYHIPVTFHFRFPAPGRRINCPLIAARGGGGSRDTIGGKVVFVSTHRLLFN